MKQAWRAADRAAEVLGAARGWRAAGRIDDAALAAFAEAHPEPGPRLGWAWRVLVFVCVAVGVFAATALGFISLGVREEGSVAAILLAAGAALALLTDAILDRSRYRPTGAEAATSLLAVSYLVASAFILCDHFHLRGAPAQRLGLAWATAVLALAAWRWGFRVYAGAAAGALLLLAANLPAPRLAWLAVAASTVLGTGASTSLSAGASTARRDFAPSHRGGIALARAVALAAAYLAVNYLSVDKGFIEEIGRGHGEPHHRAGEIALLLAWVGSALYPPLLAAWGVRTRDRALIALGIVSAGLSLATLRFYVQVAPLWAVLAASGAALAGASLLLERWLRSGAGGERAGFTAAPLYDESRRERLLPVAAALASAPEARVLPQEPRGVQGGGGGLGGGGAAGTF
jgi:hypothetical protein